MSSLRLLITRARFPDPRGRIHLPSSTQTPFRTRTSTSRKDIQRSTFTTHITTFFFTSEVPSIESTSLIASHLWAYLTFERDWQVLQQQREKAGFFTKMNAPSLEGKAASAGAGGSPLGNQDQSTVPSQPPVQREKVKQPEWQPPLPVVQPPVLKVWNSLTRSKNIFTPVHGNRIDWYNCGPTVYDSAHMGHARNYLTQDMIRRILRDYFGYEVNFVMNVTDVEDKIIIRAREQHLLAAYRTSNAEVTESLRSDVGTSLVAYFDSKLAKCLPAEMVPGSHLEDVLAAVDRIACKDQTDESWAKEMRVKNEKFGLILGSLQSAKSGLKGSKSATELIDSAKDILSWWLDKNDGHTVTDPAIFRSLAAHWETSFFDDMKRLRVIPPTIITRVSEYVPEIVTFVEKIISNGFAYEKEGDVWFDVGAFEGAKAKKEKGKGKEGEEDPEWEHVYAKLAPWSKGNRELLEDGEGSLTNGSTKRSSSDFALWKSGKPGEPTWPSPWGPGRPGWHIECSVMASEILGQKMDIHSGGVDLMFPHHDNEIAQSEAFHDCRQWVNYFLHTGHLHIQGLKMSKSLKNFITIEEALETYTPRQLRLAFMSQLWSSKMDLTPGTRSGVETIEDAFNNLFRNVKAKVADFENRIALSDGNHHYDEPERILTAELQTAQLNFREALCDSFNTPEALNVLMNLVTQANVYLQRRPRPRNITPLRNVAEWITSMLRMFGLSEGRASRAEGAIGWGEVVDSAGAHAVDSDAVLMPYLRALSTFRDDIRRLALNQASSKEILELCDRLRDNELVNLGVALDDQEDGNALVKLAPAAELIKARDEKRAMLEAKAARKIAAQQADEEKRLAKLEKGKIAPETMYRPPHVEPGVYSDWDAEGMPTKDGEGKEVSKGQIKKLRKGWEAQIKLHDEWKKTLSNGR